MSESEQEELIRAPITATFAAQWGTSRTGPDQTSFLSALAFLASEKEAYMHEAADSRRRYGRRRSAGPRPTLVDPDRVGFVEMREGAAVHHLPYSEVIKLGVLLGFTTRGKFDPQKVFRRDHSGEPLSDAEM